MTPRARRTAVTALLAALCLPSAAAADLRIVAPGGAPADPGIDAAWRQFFGALPHGAELGSLSVVLSPPEEVTRRCGAGADGCYSGLLRQMVIPGLAGPGDTYVADVARHEYGHHLAAASDNAPFESDLGTKRWFTHERICTRLRAGELSDGATARYGSRRPRASPRPTGSPPAATPTSGSSTPGCSLTWGRGARSSPTCDIPGRAAAHGRSRSGCHRGTRPAPSSCGSRSTARSARRLRAHCGRR